MEDDIIRIFPIEIWMEVFSYLPIYSHLPICHVSKQFREIWMISNSDDGINDGIGGKSMKHMITNPMTLIFQCPWKHNMAAHPNSLSTSLLKYFIDNGWMDMQKRLQHKNTYKSRILERLFRGTISRGDIPGIQFLFNNKINESDDLLSSELCTLASASGQLEVLKWLREEMNCPFDPVEMYQEAAENSQHHIMDYIEYIDDHQSYESKMSYGVGMPY